MPVTAAHADPFGLYMADGHRLFIDCAGQGRPAVLLESGLGSPLELWDPVSYMAGQVGTEVCAYDRYGVGSSGGAGQGPRTRTIDQSVSDLHALVRAASVEGPYVLAGTSIGGLIAREYARRYPKEAVGMVLFDSAPDDWDLYTGKETFTYAPESLNVAAAASALRRHDNFGAKPLVVIQAGDDSSVQASWAPGKKDFQAYWSSRQRRLARTSTDSILALATGVPHDEVAQSPAGLSERVIGLVVAAVRKGRRLPSCAQAGLPKLNARCLSEGAHI